jgi:predicted HAD superfamily Cof-like phosphohydrolase
MQQAMKQLRAFHEAMGQTVGDPTKPDCRVDLALRVRLIAEEFEELLVALEPKLKPGIVADVENWLDARAVLVEKNEQSEPDVVAAADALTDITYVTLGAGVAWGILLHYVFAEVHRSNMAKKDGEVRPDGKRLKPPGWTPPDVAGVIERGQLGIYALLSQRLAAMDHATTAGDRREADQADKAWAAIEAIDAKLKALGYNARGNKL